MTAFAGEVHPLAEVWPMLPDDDIEALAESIRDVGLLEPLVVDSSDRLVDGRNRLAACRLAGVAPHYVSLPPDVDAAGFIQARNAERRHLTAGQQAMGRALMLQAQGKRRNGRWERDSITQDSALSRGEQDNMRKAGVVLDTAARAGALGPDWADYTALPGQVMDRSTTLDFAYRVAQDFAGKAAMAEAMRTQPLTEALTRLEVILDDAQRLIPLPVLGVPLTKQHRAHIDDNAGRLAAVASALRIYAKESA